MNQLPATRTLICTHTRRHMQAHTPTDAHAHTSVTVSLTCFLGNLQKGGVAGGGTASCSKSIHQHLLESYLIKHVHTTYLFKVATGNSNKVSSEFSTITDNYLIVCLFLESNNKCLKNHSKNDKMVSVA